ncbi:BrnA antitoxin family protein [Methylobacterium durans]|uniref:BrnA antitoxin of type II toxin-antitoxin system n=1 Tax=Methylobacterium durans TaxID=2202825 RepID=A0A2U8W7H6_9HYPH|nr:BrnA antitoxin family protein [Methylobacterium durans]AWN42054.1 hypothetical protein DK389_18070 [Methylobacterium durans]
MAMDRSRRTSDPRKAAEAAFRSVTTKPAASEPAAPPSRPAVPGARESVTLRVDSAVLQHFQKDGPGWQDRINDALKKLAGV